MSVIDLLTKYTYSDYIIWEGDWEMIEGIPVSMSPAPMKIHQNIAGEIYFELKSFITECEECELLYETDWKVSNDTVLRPDIIFVCNDEGEKYITKAPKIIIEILSSSTAKKDETVKFSIYEDEGVKYYILVYPDDLRAKIYKLKNDKYIKIGDFTKEKIVFDDIPCSVELNFERVFKKFRK
jgi:Uma2 family endonuclease